MIATSLADQPPNLSFTIGNIGAWLSALCHLLGVVVAQRFDRALRPTGLWLAVGYAVSLAAIGVVTLAAFERWLPIFFIQDIGGTMARTWVLGSAVTMFILAAFLLRLVDRPSRSSFENWYSLALLLIAVGLLGAMVESSRNSALAWTCRAAFYTGGVYMLVAAWHAGRRSNRLTLAVGLSPSAAPHPYAMAMTIVLTAAALRVAFLPVLGTAAGLGIFYAAVTFAALYGGLRAGLFATAIAAALTTLLWMEPAGRFALTDARDSTTLTFFLIGGVLIAGVSEALHRARTRASRAEADARISAERERAAAALHGSELRFRSLFDTLIEGFCTIEMIFDDQDRPIDYRHIEVNPAFELLTGIGGARGKRVRELLPTVESYWIEVYGRVAKTGEPVRFTQEARALGRWYDVSAYRVGEPGSRRVAVLFNDITGRKRAEEALEEAQRRLQAAMQAVPVGISFSDDATCQRIIGNPAALAQFEVRPEDNISASAPDPAAPGRHVRFHRDGRVLRDAELPLQRAVAENRLIPPMELEVELPSGRRWFAQASGAPIHDEQGRVVGGVAATVDITARKQAEESLRQLNATLEQRVAERTEEVRHRAAQLQALAAEVTQAEIRERGRIAKVLHDELQQMLVAAKMGVNLLEYRVGATPEGRREIADLLDTLGRAIDVSRSLTAELSPPILHGMGLGAGLRWLANWMKEKHRLNVEVEAQEQAEPHNDDLRAFLYEAARELLFNVVKHAGVDRAKVRLSRADDDRIEIVIEDQGRGCDPARAGKLRVNGGGFGLFGIRERVDLLGGRTAIESVPGGGTRVRLVLPSRLASAAALAWEDEETSPRPGPTAFQSERNGKIRMVVADDHKIVREGIVGLLSKQADLWVVGQAADGIEAVELTERLRPEVVLMDVNMPRMDGVDATRRIAAERPGTIVIGLSMHSDSDLGERMRQAGAAAYLAKDGPSEALIAAIRQVRAGVEGVRR